MPTGTEERRGKIYLDMPVNYLKGVGPARAESLRRLGIVTARDLLYHIPHRYEDDSGMIEASWPGQPFLDRSIEKGDIMLLTGAVRFFHGRQLQPREFIQLGRDEDDIKRGKVLAVYPATKGLSFKVIRGIIDTHLDALLPLVNEYLPTGILREAGVPPLREAMRMVHRPQTIAEGTLGRARLA